MPLRHFALLVVLSVTSVAQLPLAVADTTLEAAAKHGAAASSPRLLSSYGKLPMSFEPNEGQADPGTRFLVHGSDYTLLLKDSGPELLLARPTALQTKRGEPALKNKSETAWEKVRLLLLGANPHPKVVGVDELRGKVNYFIGNDPSKWHSNVSTYGRARYEDAYPGIAVVYHGSQQELDYDFVLSPGADPNVIQLGFEGADKLSIEDNGDLVVRVRDGEIRQRAPNIYQEIQGIRRKVSGRYLVDGNRLRFSLSRYDKSHELVIDPVLLYSTYLGGRLTSPQRASP